MNKKPTISLCIGIFAMVIALFPISNYAAVIYVNHSAAGANNGANWTDAYVNLTDALSSASLNDEIWVAQGVYKPAAIFDLNASGGMDAREAVFTIPDGVALYGGFNGSEILITERDWGTNLTILSGDIDNNDINPDGNFIAEETDDIIGNNAYHVIYTENAGALTRLDGFIVTAGTANIAVPMGVTDPNLDGGGWYNRLSSPTYASSPSIANTSFQGNYASSEGGAFYNTPGPAGGTITSQIESCVFSRNKSGNTGGAIYLGSFNPGNYQPVIMNCEFIWNEAYRRGGAIYLVGDHATIDSSMFLHNRVTAISEDFSTLPGSGGGVSLVSSNAVFNACYFDSNSATGNPTGAFEGGGGGAVYISTNDPQTTTLGESNPVFTNCGFYTNLASGNTAAWGGAVVHLSDAGILRPLYVNCVFTDNQAQNHGGAIANFTRVISEPESFTPALEPVFTNCTFTENHAGQRGGALYNDGQLFMGSEILESAFENSILWHNTASLEGPQIYNTGNNTISYSLVENSGGSGGGWDTDLGTDGGNNIDTDPGFVNGLDPVGPDNIPATNDDGFRLAMSSAAVNAGNNTASGLTGILNDYIGNARILGGSVDMGAYERAGIIIPDLDIFWLEDWPDFDPPCLSCPLPWSFLLFGNIIRTPQFIWDGQAQLIKYDDYATISGEIVNASSQDIRFKVFIKLIQPKDWNTWSESGGTYYALTSEARKTALTEHFNWTFWKLSNESYLEGIGELSGKVFLNHFSPLLKTGFQMGEGANAWDSDLGIGGNYYYKGKLNYKGKRIWFTGLGSMNVDAVVCEVNCVPLFEQVPVVDGFALKDAEQSLEADNSEFSVYPVPAKDFIVIDINSLNSGSYNIEIMGMDGRIGYSDLLNVEDSNKAIPLMGLQPGIYILKLFSENKEAYIKKFIVE